MFRTAANRSLALRSLVRPTPAGTLRRQFAAEAKVADTLTDQSTSSSADGTDSKKQLKPTPYSQPHSIRGIIDKYGGFYPLLGLGSAIVVSKELLVMNEESLMVTNFLTVTIAAYVAFADTIIKTFKEHQDTERKMYEDWGALEVDRIKHVLAAHKRNMKQPDMLRYVKAQYNNLIVQAYKANNVQARIAARDATEKKLQEILGREQAEQSSAAKQTANDASQYVRDFFQKADKQTKNQLIENAIALLSGSSKSIPSDKDPVKQTYLKFFKEQA